MKTLTFIREKKGYNRVKDTGDLVSDPERDLAIDNIVTIKNYSVGIRHSAHPNIDKSGSVKGMIKLGYWNKNDVIIRKDGFIYNFTKIYCSHLLDELCLAIETAKYKTTYNNDASNGPFGSITYHF